jgi:hypothetical protein
LPKLSQDALKGKAPLHTFGELEAFFKAKDAPPPPPPSPEPPISNPVPAAENPPKEDGAPEVPSNLPVPEVPDAGTGG